MTADRPRRRRPGATSPGTIIGDHATVIVSGNGVLGGSGNTVTGPSPVGSGRPPARGRAGKVLVGAATVAGTVIAAMTFVVSLKNPPGAAGGTAVVPPPSSARGSSSGAPAGPRTIFDDVVVLPNPVITGAGVDLDSGAVRKQRRTNADTDMSASSSMLTASARHSALYSDTGAGDQSGAHQRCHDYRADGVETQSQALVYQSAQFCFTTSAGRPGWFQVVTGNDVDRSLTLKVVVWAT